MPSSVGQSVTRVDALAKVKGEALYPGDFNRPGQLIMKVLFSEKVHAIVKSIVRKIISAKRLTFKDTESYFSIFVDNNTRKWLCRLIVGKKNEYLQSVENFASGKNLDQFKFLNYVDDTLLAGLYAKAIANIYLSLYEGFGFPPLEAASVGSLSIVSDIPVMREIYADSVKYVNPLNINDIAAGIKDIIHNEEERSVIKSMLPELVKKYSWEESARLNIKLIEKFQN